jgi:two-component system alkaline phosphatase synthesis response regulator PhoP
VIQIVFASKEPSRASVLIEALSRSGYSVTVVHRSRELRDLMSAGQCGLLLLGQELADVDGLAFLKALKSRPMTRTLPIIAMTDAAEARFPAAAGVSGRGPSMAKERMPLRLAFLDQGADDCFTLDQDVNECLSRVRAVLRRTTPEPADEVITLGEVELNLTSYTLHVAGKPVPLTSKELDLLYVFLISPNRVLSRPYLIERVWGYDYFGSPRTVDVHVRRLRQKLGKAARFIQTVPCVGYKMIPDGRAGVRR